MITGSTYVPFDPNADDYLVRYGGSGVEWGELGYKAEMDLTYVKAVKFYDKLVLDAHTTWKELIYRPVDENRKQMLLRSDSVRTVDLGIGVIAVPDNHFEGEVETE